MIHEQTGTRLIALAAPITDRQQTIHSWLLAGKVQKMMPFPDVLLLEGDAGGCMIYRYRIDREFCGDSWYQSVDDAKSQVMSEYGNALGDWLPVPVSESNGVKYAIRFAAERSKGKK
jgi:hypothetical protein